VPEYEDFDRERWAASRAAPLPDLTRSDAGTVDRGDLRDIYAPLSEFIGRRAGDEPSPDPVPYVVSIVGSVAVGKSTSARALRAMLELGPPGRDVDVVTTDGFLYPNRMLAARGLADRKGFPETFDRDAFNEFLRSVKRGVPEVRAPSYSHEIYDIVTDAPQIVRKPDVLIVEGLPLTTDHVDLAIFVDADEHDIEQWYVERFLALCREAVDDDASFFRSFVGYSDAQISAIAHDVWVSINSVNLHEFILPARDGCDVILEKQADHRVRRVRLRTS
jgi:type I pantothenate kinase